MTSNADLIDAAISRVNAIAHLAGDALPDDVRVDVRYEGFGLGSCPGITPASALRYLTDLRQEYVPTHRYGTRLKLITLSVRVPDIHFSA